MSCRCGRHIGVKPTLIETVKQCKENEKLCQIFLGNPQSYITRNVPKDDIDATREYLKTKNMKLYVHAPYLINISREGDDSIVTKGKDSLQRVINTLHRIGPDYTGNVFHIGAKGTLERCADTLNSMDIAVPTYCENSAGEGSKLGKNMNELRKIIETTDSYNVGLCIDTCHAFSAGMTDFREMNQVENLFEDLASLNDRKIVFHVNDSLTDYRGCSDRHSPIGYGKIWNIKQEKATDTLVRFYELAKSNSNDIIFETPNEVTSELESELLCSMN